MLFKIVTMSWCLSHVLFCGCLWNQYQYRACQVMKQGLVAFPELTAAASSSQDPPTLITSATWVQATAQRFSAWLTCLPAGAQRLNNAHNKLSLFIGCVCMYVCWLFKMTKKVCDSTTTADKLCKFCSSSPVCFFPFQFKRTNNLQLL